MVYQLLDEFLWRHVECHGVNNLERDKQFNRLDQNLEQHTESAAVSEKVNEINTTK